MSLVHSKNTIVLISSASVPVSGGSDISTYVDTSEIPREREVNEVTTYGNDAKRKAKGLKDSTFTMSGVYDSAASVGPRAVILPLYDDDTETLVRITRRPEGTGSGKPQDTFVGVIVKYTETNPVADHVRWSLELDIDGEITTTAQS